MSASIRDGISSRRGSNGSRWTDPGLAYRDGFSTAKT